MPVHVLHHDDGVIHHKTDGQHHRKQRQEVHGKPHEQHQEGAPDHGQGHGHGRYDSGTDTAQAEEDHHQDDDQRLDQSMDHFIDGILDEFRGIVGQVNVQPRGQLGFDTGQLAAHPIGHVERVGPGSQFDRQVGRWTASVIGNLVVVLRAQLHIRDILEPDQAAIHFPDHQTAELFRVRDVGIRIQAHADQVTFDGAYRSLVVVGTQHIDHFPWGDVEAGEPGGIQPHAHGVGAPEKIRLAHAAQCLELGLHDPCQVVGDLRHR